jgi:hypothetical protein
MTPFYHGNASPGEPPPLLPTEWLELSYCHARALNLPAGKAADYRRRFLPLACLGPHLTTEVVLRSLVFPPSGRP